MFKLVIAKDYECRKYIKLMEGSYEKISEITSKHLNSNDIRKKSKLEYNTFYRTFKDKGDVVIIDENNKRYRVLYKDDIYAVKQLIKNQDFMRYALRYRFINNTSEFDNYTIIGRKTSRYNQYINKYFNSRKADGDFYSTIRKIEIAYENYRIDNINLPTLDKIKKDCREKRKNQALKRARTIKERKEELELLKSLALDATAATDMYETISSLNMEEIYNTYSLDELISSLSYDECKRLKIGTYKV